MASLLKRTWPLLLVLALLIPVGAMADEATPSRRTRVAGRILSVDPSQSALELHTRDGEVLTVMVTEETTFRSLSGEVESKEDLKPDMKVIVIGEESDRGFLARTIGVLRAGEIDLQRSAGVVASVSVAEATFVLDSRRHGELMFVVSDSTRFKSRNGEIQSLAELQVGMRAVVVFKRTEVGLEAIAVAAADIDSFPRFDIRVWGEITSISGSTITLTERGGGTSDLLLTPETVIKKKGGAELAVGDHALVLASTHEQGDTVAQAIVAIPGPQ